MFSYLFFLEKSYISSMYEWSSLLALICFLQTGAGKTYSMEVKYFHFGRPHNKFIINHEKQQCQFISEAGT